MKSSRYTPEQVAFGLRQGEEGTSKSEVCRKMGISEQTFSRWKKELQGMGVAQVRRMWVMEEESRKLKQLMVGRRAGTRFGCLSTQRLFQKVRGILEKS